MKSRILTLMLLASAHALVAQTQPASPTAIPEDAGSKKARAVLNQMIQTMGGEAFLTYQDMTQQGRTARFYHGNPAGTSTLFWFFWKWPDKDRVEYTKQRDVTYIHNGDKGYEITYKGTRPEEAEDLQNFLRNREYSLPVVLRVWLKDPATTLFFDGTGIVDQKQVNKVTVMNAKNQSVTLAIDTYTHLLVRKSYQWREPDTRYLNEEAEIYGNYHKVQGIQTPRNIVSVHNGDITRQRFVDSSAYNVGLADGQFQATVTYDPTQKKSR